MPLCCTRPAGAAKRRSRAPATANRQKAALNHEERGGEGRNGSNASRSRIEDRLQFTLLFLFPFCCCSHSVPASRSIAFHDRHEVSLSLSFERKSCSGKTRQTALGSEGEGLLSPPFYGHQESRLPCCRLPDSPWSPPFLRIPVSENGMS